MVTERTGTIDSMVYQLVSDVFSMLPVETQEIEGTNSMTKRIYQLSPNIKLPLMSDWILIKKALTTKVTTIVSMSPFFRLRVGNETSRGYVLSPEQ